VRSSYWRLDKIRCPVLSIGHWGKMGLHLRGNILGYEEVTAPKKLVVTGARNTFEAHRMFDEVEFHDKELKPFYDLHLKGANNAFMDSEPVKLFVRGTNVWRAPEAWPPPAVPTSYYLRHGPSGSVTSLNDGALSTEPPTADETPTRYSYPDWQWINGVAVIGGDGRVDPVRRVLTFTSAPLAADLEIGGPIVLKLYAASSAVDTQFIVKLSDQHPQDAASRGAGEQPGYTVVSKGWLKASHREKDPLRSTPERPFYTHTNPQPLTPGEIYEFDIEVLPACYVFKKGHRIRLELANGDSPATDGVFSHPYHPSLMGADTFHHDTAHASRLILPVVAAH